MVVRIDVYLPLGSDYDDDLRDSYDYDESITEAENKEKARKQFISKYGFPTANRNGQFKGGSKDARYTNQYEWNSSTKQSVVIEINGIIKKSLGNRYTPNIDQRILELTLQKLKIKEIQEQINNEFKKDYTKVAIRDRRLRLQGKK